MCFWRFFGKGLYADDCAFGILKKYPVVPALRGSNVDPVKAVLTSFSQYANYDQFIIKTFKPITSNSVMSHLYNVL